MQKFYIEKIPMVLPSLDVINEVEELVSKLILEKVNEDIENFWF